MRASASRLPRLASSPEPPLSISSAPMSSSSALSAIPTSSLRYSSRKRPRDPDTDQEDTRPTKSLATAPSSTTNLNDLGRTAPLPRPRIIKLPHTVHEDDEDPLNLKVSPPSATTEKTRVPLSFTNPNVTRRVKGRATSAPPKSIRPPPSGVVAGRRAGDQKLVPGGAKSNGFRVGVDMQAEHKKANAIHNANSALENDLKASRDSEREYRMGLMQAADQLESEKRKHAKQVSVLAEEKNKFQREAKSFKEENKMLQTSLENERNMCSSLKAELGKHATVQLTLETQLSAAQNLTRTLQSEVESRLSNNSDMRLQLEYANKQIAQLQAEAHESETIRRKLHNLVQELKGNIRVYCRVRPMLPDERKVGEELACITFPDREQKEIVFTSSSESATGQERKDIAQFSFDRVFQPAASQIEVFEDISQLVQSVTDGYNCTIFSYGQTGSGKTFTMEGGQSDNMQGMIPRAVRQVFETAELSRAKGWEYSMEGQFLEIYNETINDLLGTGEFDKKKHEIKHDKSGKTTVTDVVSVPLNGPSQVANLLVRAQSRRSVATTLMNERSSRSHSVFTLRIQGVNRITKEECVGCLNLVDLAGSERLSSSGSANHKERLKETQAINKSLSSLGDVIAALGAGSGAHIPYRNSKLTYLLQNSLGGNSKTLMILNLSPLAASYGESICSLRFATKVNNTTIGQAKKQIKSTA